MAELEVADEYDDNTAGYLSQPIAFPASVLNRIASFLPLKDVRNLGACCTSAFVLCCDHIDRLTVRVPKTKRLQPLFRGFAKYANVTRVTGAPCEMTGACVHGLPLASFSSASQRTSYVKPGFHTCDQRAIAGGCAFWERYWVGRYVHKGFHVGAVRTMGSC